MGKIKKGLKEYQEYFLILVTLINGVFYFVKQISWRILCFFIAYLALIGCATLEKPSALDEAMTNSNIPEDYFMIAICFVFLVVVVKIIATQIWTEQPVAFGILILSFLFSFILGYSFKNFLEVVSCYLSVSVLEWICTRIILAIDKGIRHENNFKISGRKESDS